MNHESYYEKSPFYASLFDRFDTLTPFRAAEQIARNHGATVAELGIEVSDTGAAVMTLDLVVALGY